MKTQFIDTPCPMCKNKTLKKALGVSWKANLLRALLFRPGWIISLIRTYTISRFKCHTCKEYYSIDTIAQITNNL